MEKCAAMARNTIHFIDAQKIKAKLTVYLILFRVGMVTSFLFYLCHDVAFASRALVAAHINPAAQQTHGKRRQHNIIPQKRTHSEKKPTTHTHT